MQNSFTNHYENVVISGFSLEVHSYGFNGKELDSEGMGGGSSTYDYGFRIYNPAIARFLSVDPVTRKFGELTPYQYASLTPIQAIDLDGLEAFFIHGTTSTNKRWTENSETIPTLLKLTNNKHYDDGFNWNAPLLNNETDRSIAALTLTFYVMAHRVEGEEITLVGHSHGGNVAIQAAGLIYAFTGEKVNIVTVNTPAFNTENGRENPEGKAAINDMVQVWNEADGVAGGLAGDDFFTSNKARSLKADASIHYQNGTRKNLFLEEEKYTTLKDSKDAHSMDVEHPEDIDKAIRESGMKLNPVTNTTDTNNKGK